MSFYGDLSSMNIADLLQNLEANQQTGTLYLEGTRSQAWIYFQSGSVAMLATNDRPELFERLVITGTLSASQLEKIRHKRRGSRKSLVETAVAMKLVDEAALAGAASQFLVEDLCEIVMNSEGEFRFREGAAPPRTFDPGERRLGLGVAPGPLLLEAARREDHWKVIRKVIPSDSVHFFVPRNAQIPDDIGDAELAVEVVRTLDGSRDVRQVLSLFPGRRFQVFQILGALVRHRVIEAVEADGLLEIASKMGGEDPKRARELIADALREQPKHLGLLDSEARLAEQMGDSDGASAALKMSAYVHLEQGHVDEARKLLQTARRITPKDTAIAERLLALEVDEGRVEEAVDCGLELVKLYREPGLHRKACDVLERSQVDSGDPKSAVRGLCRHGKVLIGREEYQNARRLYEEVLRVEPGNKEAERSVEAIDSEAFRRRKVRRRSLVRRAIAATLIFAIGAALFFDYTARVDFAQASSGIRRDRLIEELRYQEAIARYREVEAKHRFTLTYLIDIRPTLEELEEVSLPPR